MVGAAQRGLFILGLLALAYFASVVFIPIFLALFLAILLEPPVKMLVARRIPRSYATLFVVGLFILASAVTGWTVSRAIIGIAGEVPEYSTRIKALTAKLRHTTERLERSTDSLGLTSSSSTDESEEVQKVKVIGTSSGLTQSLISSVGSISEIISLILFVPLLLSYFLLDKQNLIESFNEIVGKYCYLPRLNSDLPKMLRAFFAGNMLTGLILVAAHGALFYWLGLSNWLALAVLTGFLNLIPLAGWPLASILPLLQGVIQGHGATNLFVLAAVLFIYHAVAGNLILPQLVATRINVNSLSLVIGLIFWGWLWGAIGFLLAIPMTALIKIFLESNASTFPIANLLAARPRYVIPADRNRRMKPQGLSGYPRTPGREPPIDPPLL